MKFVGYRVFSTCILMWTMILSLFGQDHFSPIDSLKPLNFEVEIRNDNDMYLMILQDQYYTNGLFINLRKQASNSVLGRTELNRIYEVSLAHKMYNPYTAQIDDVEMMDRPFAGVFSVSGAVQHHLERDHMLRYGIDLEVVGPASQGELLQNHLHNLLNMYHTAGWEYQIKNSFGIDAFAGYSGTLFRAGRWLDASVQAEGIAGLHAIRAVGSGTLRLGRVNPFSSSAHFHARLQSRQKSVPNEFYLYGTAKAHAVGYDVTLQGGRFSKGADPFVVAPNRQVYSAHAGVVLATRAFSFRSEYIIQTKESAVSKFRHQYGTVSVAVRL